MRGKAKPPIPEPILQLQRQLYQFRSTQPRRAKLPESLWEAAVELARQHEDAYPVEGIGATRLGQSAARLAGNGRMIQITPQMRIVVAVESVDFRKGIDSLAELCRQKLDADPFSGYLFVFRSRRATSI